MTERLGWLFPTALFLFIAATYAVRGEIPQAAAYAVFTFGYALYAVGQQRGSRPLRLVGAGLGACSLVVVLWMAFA